MSSPGGPRVGSGSNRLSPSFFAACGGGSSRNSNEIPSISPESTKSTRSGQQSICAKCNRNFRRSDDAKPNSDDYERCEFCRTGNGVGEWLQESCAIS